MCTVTVAQPKPVRFTCMVTGGYSRRSRPALRQLVDPIATCKSGLDCKHIFGAEDFSVSGLHLRLLIFNFVKNVNPIQVRFLIIRQTLYYSIYFLL